MALKLTGKVWNPRDAWKIYVTIDTTALLIDLIQNETGKRLDDQVNDRHAVEGQGRTIETVNKQIQH